MKSSFLAKLAIGVLAITLMGCAKKSVENTEMVDEGFMPTTTTTSGAAGLSPFFEGTKNLSPEDQSLLETRVFYFDYDDPQIRNEYFEIIRAHARNLVANPTVHIRVEGHTDGRGSREYNIALGERRAQAVMNVLLMEGANREQVSVVSYGKEKPAVPGHDESAYQYNRRAVIVYEAG
ncbi:MAG: peptidoglycan-associated lipoprotein Pal [Gammaproteobacteria bacterium]